MITRIFKYISKRLNTLLKFINLRILKRKKAITIIEFLYLALSKFQQTKIFQLLVFIYKTVGIFLAFVSFGVFYKENFNFNDLNYLLASVRNTIISIYNIIYNTIISIYKIIFTTNKENEEETIQEPYDYYLDTNKLKYIFQEEATPWCQDGYIIGGIIIFILCLGLWSYSNWDSDSNFKDNLQNMSSDLYNIMKEIKNKIINLFTIRRNTSSDDDSNTESNNDSFEDETYFNLPNPNQEVNINSIDSRILSDPYMYPLFKNINELDHWPKYGTEEHDALISKTFNPKSKEILYTYEHYNSLIDSMMNLTKNNVHVSKDTANKAVKLMEKTNNDYSLWKHSGKQNELTPNQSNINLYETTPKASTSDLPITHYKDNYEMDYTKSNKTFLDNLKKNNQNNQNNQTFSSSLLTDNNENTFDSNLKGKFKATKSIFGEKFEELRNESNRLLAKTADIINATSEIVGDDNLDLPILTDRAAEISNANPIPLPPAPPAPPAPPLPITNESKVDNSNPLLNSIKSFTKKGLKKVNENDLNLYSKAKVDQGKLKALTGTVKEIIKNEDNPHDSISDLTEDNNIFNLSSQLLDNSEKMIKPNLTMVKTNLTMNDCLNNPSLLEAGMSVGKDGTIYKPITNETLDNVGKDNPLNEIYDLKSDIYVRSMKAAGFKLNEDGTVTKIESKVGDNNPLTHKLSTQLDKMKIFDDNINDEIKIAPSFEDNIKNRINETSKIQSQNNFNENEQDKNPELNKKQRNWAGLLSKW